MTVYVGLDLAWTATHPSGVCVVEEDRSGRTRLLEIASRMTPAVPMATALAEMGPDVVVAVDAPLIRTEACTAERELGRVFGRYRAGAYLASMTFLESRRPPLDMGPRLGRALLAAGFSLNPLDVTAGSSARQAFEMYPHAFHVAVFGLEERILYKKGRRAVRLAGLARYQELLRGMLERWTPEVAMDPGVRALLRSPALEARGAALKAVEDQLDALTCMLSAVVARQEGIRRGEVFGDPIAGSIAVPGMHLDSRFMAQTVSCC